MKKKSRLPKVILFVFWINALLAYLSFSSVSMPMMEMGRIDSDMAHHTGENSFAMPCCEMIGTACISFICNVSEFTKIPFIKGTSRIISVTTGTQLIFLDILSPPPKA